MPDIILAINAGSSSVKVSVYSSESSSKDPQELAVIQVSGLTAPPASLKYDRGDEHIKDQELSDVKDTTAAFEHILKHLISDSGLTQLTSPDSITFACHRIVHGGDYSTPETITKETYHKLETLSDLAPLHNAGALTIVRAVHDQCPSTTNIAFFDSAFHSTLPPAIRTYPINPDLAARNKLRKYGFHGLSYAFITRALATHLSHPKPSLIALHLGSGASACAIQDGHSLDTTMGLTPLAGLPGATRSGDVDPSLIFHMTHDAGRMSSKASEALHITRAEEVLNQECGWKAMTGTTDFGEVSKRAEEGDEKAKLAVEVLVDRIVGYAGSYFVKLGGKVDGLVFAGGIGEKGVELREEVVRRLECLGFGIDKGKNEKVGDGVVEEIGAEGSKFKVFVCKTDEQAEMARQCAQEADKFRQ